MKKQIINGFVPLNELELTILTLEVEETIAKNFSAAQDRIINSQDLWRKWDGQEEGF